MSFLQKIPRHIRWVFAIMIAFLITLTIYRFIFFFHFRSAHRPFSGSTFLLGLRFDAKFVSILGLGMLILSAIPFLNPFKHPRSAKGWIFFISLLFLICLVFFGADFYHYDYLKQRLNASVLNFLQDAGISFNMMYQSYPIIKIAITLVLLVSTFTWWQKRFWNRINAIKPSTVKRKRPVIYIVFILVLGILSFGKVGQYPLRWSDAFVFADDFKASTALNPFQSFFSTLSFKNSSYDKKKVEKYYPLMASYFGLNKRFGSYERFSAVADTFINKPNVVLVICESFSAYKSSMYGNPLNTTPYFNEMCRNGIFFDRCFTPSFGTARGVWATITGIPDVENPRTASRNPAAVDQHTIINDFKGYDRLYFLGGDPTWANIQGLLSNNIYGLHIYSQDEFKAKKVDVWGISDKNLFLEANNNLKARTRPFFAIIQTADNHRPYTISSEDKETFKLVNYSDEELKKNGFDNNNELNAFRYTDFGFKTFIEASKKETYFKNTIFIFVGDHGIRGNAGELFPKSWTEEELTPEHVPLLFYSPGLLIPKRIHTISSQVDILPSVASLAKIPYTNTTLGRDLFDTAFTNAATRYAFIIDPDVKSIGLVSDQYYFRKNQKTGTQQMVSVMNDDPVVSLRYTDSIQQHMNVMTDAWYETAKYLLLNNKKKN